MISKYRTGLWKDSKARAVAYSYEFWKTAIKIVNSKDNYNFSFKILLLQRYTIIVRTLYNLNQTMNDVSIHFNAK